ncbi:thiamine ABC transporter substrate binding subunit [Pararhizobium mangrovi]|uniref:Thiamine-binding periplasmic protein n=1 Tax=Pararhizobium mangrovi TaxID=2590452 RepID=A0A506UDJ5_9HYPH|nr:thiamine ABC transporter substrate binding subunit [Pararhizobium mangrovi]TPW30729.1 thiamine ABC transporter substrate binding subunit [Pararhizobium mangrovi]
MRPITLFTAAVLSIAMFAGTARAADKPVLTVYTYDSFTADWGPGPKVKAAFEKTCGCTLEWVGAEDGVALLNRLRLEGQSSKADVVLGLDTNLVAAAKKTGLFAPVDIDRKAIDVPGGFSDPDFVPFDYGYFAVVYDSKTIKNPPKSMKELVDGDPDTKIAIEDPRTSTPGLSLLLWMKKIYGDDAGKAWSKLSRRVLTVSPSWSDAYGLFTKGEVPMVLSYTTSPMYHMMEDHTDRYRAAHFSEGHYMQIEVAGMLKNAAQPKLAEAFLQFMVSPAFQDVIPTTNWMLPAAHMDKPIPTAFEKRVKVEKPLLYDPQTVAEHRKAWIDEWLAAMSK